jgi:hypothetical protein
MPDPADLTALTETELRTAMDRALRQIYAYAHYDRMSDQDRADLARCQRDAARAREEIAARGLPQ